MKRIPLQVGLGIALGGALFVLFRGGAGAWSDHTTEGAAPKEALAPLSQELRQPRDAPSEIDPRRAPIQEAATRREAFELAMAIFMAWSKAQGTPEGWERYWREEEERWSAFVEDLKRKDPRFEDYPFLDPIADAPSDPLYHGTFVAILGFEQTSVRKGYWWDEFVPEAPLESQRKLSEAVMGYYDVLAGMSPLQIASSPWYGDVPKERIRENLELLAALRMEYIHDALPLLDQRSRLQGWQGLARTLPSRLPEGARGDFDDLIDERIREIEAQLEPYRARYLRAVGEAIGATELPPID